MPHVLRVLRGGVVETGGTLLAKHGLAQTAQPLVDYFALFYCTNRCTFVYQCVISGDCKSACSTVFWWLS